VNFSLANDGDAIEKRWAGAVTLNFKNYEPFWTMHVAPITRRTQDRTCLYVRSDVPDSLRKLATYNYGTFLHLAGCHEQLEVASTADEAGAQLFARLGMYYFYSRLYSSIELIPRFLKPVRNVLDEYHGSRKHGRNHEEELKLRLRSHQSGDLWDRYTGGIQTCRAYRGQQVHDWGFPARGRRVPSKDFLKEWQSKDLGEIDRLLRNSDFGKRIDREFVDAVSQSGDDLAFVENVINDIWKVALDELETIADVDRYRRDQAKGEDQGLPHRFISGSFPPVSGAV